MRYIIGIYLLYLAVSVALTVWLARTLYANGATFLEDVFDDRPGLAAALNRLLVTGFFMLNLGYALLLLQAPEAATGVEALHFVVRRLGLLLVSLAAIHFLNLLVFGKLRRRGAEPGSVRSSSHHDPYAEPPVPPQAWAAGWASPGLATAGPASSPAPPWPPAPPPAG